MFWPPIETCKFVNDSGDSVDGHVSNGDFHWKSPNPLVADEAINRQINTPVGWRGIANDMYNNDVGKGVVYAYEAYEAK